MPSGGEGTWQREMLWSSYRPAFVGLQDLCPVGGDPFSGHQERPFSPQPGFDRCKWRQDASVCHHKRMQRSVVKLLILQESFLLIFLMQKKKKVIWKYPFSPVLCFLSNLVLPRPNEHYLASCQTKHLPAKCPRIKRNMWWESVLRMFCGNKLLMRLQKQSFLPCSLNLNKLD